MDNGTEMKLNCSMHSARNFCTVPSSKYENLHKIRISKHPLYRRRSRGSRRVRSPPPPLKKKQITNIGGKNPPFHVLVLEDTFTDVFDITCDMADFKAHIHIFCPQTTCELSKKHHESGTPKNCLLMHCDKSKYGHTRHCEDCKEVCLCQRTTRRAFWRI